MPQLLYLASPYSHPDEAVRIARFDLACAAMCRLIESGRLAISPIVHSHPLATFGMLPGDWAGWQNLDLELLERCDTLVVLPIDGYLQSVGVAHEVAYAISTGKTVRVLMQAAQGQVVGLREAQRDEKAAWSNVCEDYFARKKAARAEASAR